MVCRDRSSAWRAAVLGVLACLGILLFPTVRRDAHAETARRDDGWVALIGPVDPKPSLSERVSRLLYAVAAGQVDGMLVTATWERVHRSFDGGATWTTLPDSPIVGNPRGEVTGLALSRHSRLSVARRYDHLVITQDWGVTWLRANRIWMGAGPPREGPFAKSPWWWITATSIAAHPTDPMLVYAELMEPQPGGAIWGAVRSRDGGWNWEPREKWVWRRIEAVDLFDAERVYATRPGYRPGPGYREALYRSDDGGLNFEDVGTIACLAPDGDKLCQAAASLRISVVSTRFFVLWGNGSIVVSDDQGATWYAGPRLPNGLGGLELAVGGATGDWLYVLADDRTLWRYDGYAHAP